MNSYYIFTQNRMAWLALSVCLLMGTASYAQTSGGMGAKVEIADSTQFLLHTARKYQYGLNRDLDVTKAKAYYQQALKSNSPEAMNKLGLLYWKEPGANRDREAAFKLFEKAAKMNYPRAMHNLARMYQNEYGIPQDFDKAFQLYKQAADSGHLSSIYWTGYFLYKGLGVEQSYAKAIEYFTRGADRGDARCIYMLGCCNMHGYGMAQNFDKAKDLFSQALHKGEEQAMYIVLNHTIDSIKSHPHLPFTSLSDVKKGRFIPDTMPRSGNTSSADSLQGRWTGKLYTYDWSHSIVESEEDMVLDLKTVNGKLNATWSVNGKELMELGAKQEQGVWKVEHASTDNDKNVYHSLKSLVCKVCQRNDSLYITGNLERKTKESNEPMRPTYFILDKELSDRSKAVKTVQDTTFVINRIYPNPMDNQLCVEFTVTKSDQITFQIHTMVGLSCFSTKKKSYSPGTYSITINPVLPVGNYNLIVLGRQYIWSQNIIKN